MPEPRIPTINDLRVKLCYICREEELFDANPDPSSPSRRWTHPCNCTLIAHETCLLKWIQASQADASRSQKALKCPQCGAEYELASRPGRVLVLINATNRVLQQAGKLFTVGGALGCAAIFGTGVYIILTGYGAHAVEKFIGKEMYELLLTDDPTNWPWTAYLNLPCLTLSLIIGRLQPASAHALLLPLLLVWPHVIPVSSRVGGENYQKRVVNVRPSSWSLFHLGSWSAGSHLAQNVILPRWPPSPFVCAIVLVPLARALYTRAFARLQELVLGASPPRRQERAGAAAWEWIRIRMQDEGQRQGQIARAGAGPDADELRVAIVAEVGVVAGNGQFHQQPDAPVLADENNPAANVAAAEQLVLADSMSLGRQIGGALLIPTIAGKMGTLLLRLSLSRKGGLAARWLRQFLGVHADKLRGASIATPAAPSKGWFSSIFPVAVDETRSWLGLGGTPVPRPTPPPRLLLGPWASGHDWENLGLTQQIRLGLQLVLGLTWNGTRAWADSDPIWWRNTIGMGLFVVAKDCLRLLHVFLAKRELESRHVRSRDFSGVDVKELDLLPSFSLQQQRGSDSDTNTNHIQVPPVDSLVGDIDGRRDVVANVGIVEDVGAVRIRG